MSQNTRRILWIVALGGTLLLCACCALWGVAYWLSPFPLQGKASPAPPTHEKPPATRTTPPSPATQPAARATDTSPTLQPASRPTATPPTTPRPPEQPRTGYTAPDFSLDTLDGERITLSTLRGQAVIVNFWATWCPPCRDEMPAFENVYRDLQDEGLLMLAVNTTDQDSEADVRAFVAEYGLTFPIALDRRGEASRRYRITGMPTTFFIGRDGVIRSVIVGGPMSEAEIRFQVQAILANR